MMEYTANYKKASVHVFNDMAEIARGFFDLIAEEMIATMTSGQNYHLCLSGGSTPLKMFEHLRVLPLNKMKWDHFHVYWGDERCVPPVHPESNYGNARKAIIDFMHIPESNIHRIIGENDPVKESLRYEKELTEYLPTFSGIPCFDLVILGLGEDGHTASIFPGQEDLLISDHLVKPSINPNNEQNRITLTPKIINNSKNIIFLVTGASKASIIEEIITEQGNYKNYPASIIRPANGYLLWYLDAEAGKYLMKNQ